MIFRISNMLRRDGVPVSFYLSAYRDGERISSNLYSERNCGCARQWVARVVHYMSPEAEFGLEDAGKLLDAKEIEVTGSLL